jgi:hypothetical protein
MVFTLISLVNYPEVHLLSSWEMNLKSIGSFCMNLISSMAYLSITKYDNLCLDSWQNIQSYIIKKIHYIVNCCVSNETFRNCLIDIICDRVE